MKKKEQKNNAFLGTEPVGKLLFKLALPSVAAQIINMLYNMVDRIYIGHIPQDGALALTGVGVCFPIIMLVSAFAALVSMGGAPRASIAMGKGENVAAEAILGNCFVLQIMVSIVLTVILLLWNRPLLLLFGASGNTIAFASGYMGIYALGTVFVQLTLGMNAFITAQGFAKTGMLTVLIGAICNILLDPILIFGLGMGVRGAALATILSQAVSAVWVMHFLRGEKTVLRLKREHFCMQGESIGPCVALGLSPFIMQSSESILAVCFNASLLKYGGDLAVGAMTILTSVMQFALLPLQGLSQGAQPITSYNFGAGKAERVRKTFFLLLKICLTYSIILWGFTMLFPGMWARIFTGDEPLIAYTSQALRIYIGGVCIFGAQMACQMTFVALGKARESIIVAVLRKFVLLIPLIFILPHFLVGNKAMAVYLAEPVSDIVAGIFTVVLFGIQFKKALSKMEQLEQEKANEE